ncbi:hypothetical protein [Pararhizobium sp. IMCC21322]|uniref:hypothetical protein n=1 Tax=Pararhizobium sp. IMCC21322 TaxID=3067903 RepID=UPI0027407CD4|nr:hypothetical protein [Pararhizobium sp. IMCC21322]
MTEQGRITKGVATWLHSNQSNFSVGHVSLIEALLFPAHTFHFMACPLRIFGSAPIPNEKPPKTVFAANAIGFNQLAQ